MQDHIGCIGSANSSGWMTNADFIITLNHFIKHVRPSKEHPILLLLDNHESHVSLEAVTLAKENGIVMLSFPPHTSHKLQPLDRGVYGPFKKFMNSYQDSWMKMHPGQNMTIYDLPGIVSQALPKANSVDNIVSGFRVSGIWPFDRHIFKDHEFAPASTTDRDDPDAPAAAEVITPAAAPTIVPAAARTDTQAAAPILAHDSLPEPTPSTSKTAVEDIPSTSDNGSNSVAILPRVLFSPTDVRPLPKAQPRKKKAGGRQPKKCAILTDTPEKEAIEKATAARNAKKKKAPASKNKVGKPAPTTVKKTPASTQEATQTDCECCVCGELWSESRDGEVWLPCISCNNWAHELCTDKENFECNECEE